MQVVRGREMVELGPEAVAELLAPFPRLAVDLGTGDGHLPYQLARADPRTLYLGLDANADNLRESSRRALRKPSRGGLANVAFAVADAEHPPGELSGRADAVTVMLPWGKLMAGLVLGEDRLLAGLASLARPGATLEVVLNGEVWGDPVPVEARALPPPTVAHVREVLAPRYRRHGISIDEVHRMTGQESRALSTTWAKRLRHGRREPNFLAYRGQFATAPRLPRRY